MPEVVVMLLFLLFLLRLWLRLGCCWPAMRSEVLLASRFVMKMQKVASLAACCSAALQSVFDDLKKELQLRSVANGEFDSEHMETGVLMLGGPHP